MPIDKNWEHSWSIGNSRLTAVISPCSWMYPGTPFQIQAVLEGGGNVYLQHEKTFASISPAEAVALCEKVKLIPCACGSAAFDPAVHAHDTNRNGLCESCFMRALTAQFAIEEAKERKRAAAQDARMAAKGFTHKVVAWVHPAKGGDDYMVDIYYPCQPTAADIRKVLRRKGSRVFNDFIVTTISIPKGESENA